MAALAAKDRDMAEDALARVFNRAGPTFTLRGGEALARPGQPIDALYRLEAGRIAELKPGETRHVSIPLDFRSLAYYDLKTHAWKADSGTFNIYVGRSDADIQLQGKLDYRP